MKRTLFLAVLIVMCTVPVVAFAQSCRANFGGSYTAPHSGIKPDGNFFTTTGFFDFNPVGTFNVTATIVEPNVRTFDASAFSNWWWVGPCDIAIDRAAFVGHVSDDGRLVSLQTFDEETLTGIGTRDSPRPDRSVAQALGVEGAFGMTGFGRLFADSLADQFSNRAAALRSGATGFALGPMRISQLPVASDAGRTVITDDRFGGFVAGGLLFGDRAYLPSETSRSFTVGGMTLGLDYRIAPNTTIGLAGSYFTGDLDVIGGKTSGRGGALSLYGTTEAGPLYFDGYAGGGLTGYSTSRGFSFGGVPFAASGSPDGHFVAAGGNAGYRFDRAGLRWGPVGELRFNQVSIDAYSETGALAARVRARDSTSVQTGLGGEIAADLSGALGTLTPRLRATWRHEFGDSHDTAIAGFLTPQVGAAPLVISSASLGRDFLAVTAGLSARLARDITLSADYVGEIGRANQTVHQVSLTARIVF